MLYGKKGSNLVIATTKWQEGKERQRTIEEQRLKTYLTANNLDTVVGPLERFDGSYDSALKIVMDALNKASYVFYRPFLDFRNETNV